VDAPPVSAFRSPYDSDSATKEVEYMSKPHIPLDQLKAQAEECRSCELCEGRTHLVFGVGDPLARVLIVGEAPGKNEDLQGEPFVGAAGKYLNELLELADLKREEVYIANVLKCRPPGNRDPRPEEIQACTPFLREQTRTIDPDFIVTLGNFSTKFILKTDKGITGLHGKLQKAGKFNVFPIFHPAAAIYDRSKRDALEEDFRTLGRLLKEVAEQKRLAAEQAAAEQDERQRRLHEQDEQENLFERTVRQEG
jgi:uracil-DNA glycosylase family 4